jgi:protein-disulfide isomerase
LSKTAWIIFTVTTVGVFALLIAISGNSQIDVSNVDTNVAQSANNQNGNIADHIYGKNDSKVTLIEYGDFQCPGCGLEHVEIRSIIEQYKDQIQFIFRNYPITTSHPNAKAAAGATEAASLQGKYWEMHNKIYETQSEWSSLTGNERTDVFVKYARELGLNEAQFKTDLSSESVTKKIAYDYYLGKKDNVTATPSFYLNGTNLDSELWGKKDKLVDAINTELEKAGIALPELVSSANSE